MYKQIAISVLEGEKGTHIIKQKICFTESCTHGKLKKTAKIESL